MKRLRFLLVGLAITLLPNISSGALNAYMRLTGAKMGVIQGSVTQAGREGTIMVIAYSHSVATERSPETCRPTDVKNHQPIMITKEIDKSTPLLFQAWATDENLSGTIEFWQPSGTGTEQQHYTVAFSDARIVGIRQEMLNNKYPENMQHKEREHIAFTYGTVTRVYVLTGVEYGEEWRGNCTQTVRISDMNFDGIVNLFDMAILADDWLQ